MGLTPLWRERKQGDDGVAEALSESRVTTQMRSSAEGLPADAPPFQTGSDPGPCSPTVPQPSDITATSLAAASTVTETVAEVGEAGETAMSWEQLESEIRACRLCRLCEQRKQAVPGVGDHQANWLFVGEGPGAEEDRRGEPFVGPAGKLLDAMLHAIALSRSENVYIANSVKCRPPMNRTPHNDEIEACLPYLRRQIQLLQPRIIVALGRPAAQSLLNMEVKISSVRGKVFSYQDVPVIVTYHPAYLLRNPADKRKAWEDLCFARTLTANRH